MSRAAVVPPRTSSSVVVSPACGPDGMRAFVDLPFRLYRDDPNWVAPFRTDLTRQLDPARGPFFDHGRARYFLARRDDRVVGRISAHVDRAFNMFHADEPEAAAGGFWGFFECDDDPDAACALFDAAAGWLAGQGMSSMLGPASFSLNDQAGLLVDGFAAPPMIEMTYNPPYYRRLVESAGFTKAQDLFAYRLESTAEPPADLVALARSAETLFTFRTVRMRDFDAELERFLRVYNAAWERNWGFSPMTEREIRHHAKQLKPVLDPNLVIVGERGGETVAVGLTIPNVNEEIIRMHGRYSPAGLARLLWRAKRRRWESCRVYILGVRREFRESGIGAHLYLDTLAAVRHGGYRWGEMSWILESNDAMNRAIRHMGGTVYKTYRMYQRPIPTTMRTTP